MRTVSIVCHAPRITHHTEFQRHTIRSTSLSSFRIDLDFSIDIVRHFCAIGKHCTLSYMANIIIILPRLHQRFDGATGWGIHRRGQLARSRRSAISEEEEAANPDQHREGRASEKAETACTHCGLALQDSAQGSGDNHMGVPVPCPHGRLCTSVACWNERIAARKGIQTRGPASCAAARGRGEDDPPTGRSLLGACQ